MVENTSMNPLLLYDLTILELNILIEQSRNLIKSKNEDQVNIMALAINNALSGKNTKLYKEVKNKVGNLKDRKDTFSDLDDI